MGSSALILVDIQNDFLPGGALAVADGDAVVGAANALIASGSYDLLVATQDWHPPHHESFAVHHDGFDVGQVIDLHGLSQVLWPVHCVQETAGAAFSEELETRAIDAVFRKGQDPQVDSYSGFFDNGHRVSTGLSEWLREHGVSTVGVCGLATDFCVKFTALDAVAEGFETLLHLAACRGVELSPGDSDRAVEEMRRAGVRTKP